MFRTSQKVLIAKLMSRLVLGVRAIFGCGSQVGFYSLFPPFARCLLVSLLVGVLILYPLRSWKPFHIVAVAIAVSYYCIWRFQSYKPSTDGLFFFIERHVVKLLLVWILVYLLWSGVVLFSNPFVFEFNHGDTVYYTQTLWNLVHGLRPETSFFTMNGMLQAGDDPRYMDAYGYISIFTMHQNWLPTLLTAPLYALCPEPPMQVYSLLVWCVVLGVSGIYWAARQAGATATFAFFAAVAYSLLPQFEIQMFFKGYVEALGLGLLPWMFGALFGKRWILSLFFAFLVAAISFPFTQFVIMVGLVAMVFFRAFLPGLGIVLIGFGMMKFDEWVFAVTTAPYLAAGEVVPSYLKLYILDRTISSLVPAAASLTVYYLYLFQAVVFLPLLALWRNHRWNMQLLGLLFLLLMAFGASLFRSYGWEFQRNSFFIVPVYMMAIVAYVSLRRDSSDAKQTFNAPAALLFAGLTSAIFLGSPYIYPPLASHFPWGVSGKVTETDDTRQWRNALKVFRSHVAEDATLAWWASSEVQATLSNRQHVWYMNREPKGVRYYVFFGPPRNPAEEAQWHAKMAELAAAPDFRLVYEGNPGKRLVIYENLKASVIPRDEKLLGWEVLLGRGEK